MIIELCQESLRGGPGPKELADSAEKRIWHSEAM